VCRDVVAIPGICCRSGRCAWSAAGWFLGESDARWRCLALRLRAWLVKGRGSRPEWDPRFLEVWCAAKNLGYCAPRRCRGPRVRGIRILAVLLEGGIKCACSLWQVVVVTVVGIVNKGRWSGALHAGPAVEDGRRQCVALGPKAARVGREARYGDAIVCVSCSLGDGKLGGEGERACVRLRWCSVSDCNGRSSRRSSPCKTR
jgi:hypothetical protein